MSSHISNAPTIIEMKNSRMKTDVGDPPRNRWIALSAGAVEAGREVQFGLAGGGSMVCVMSALSKSTGFQMAIEAIKSFRAARVRPRAAGASSVA